MNIRIIEIKPQETSKTNHNLFCCNNYVTMLVFLYALASLIVKYVNIKNFFSTLIITGGIGILFLIIKILIESYKSRKNKKINFYTNLDNQVV